ncbi:hypothetical protein, partial [Achromobacter sp.]|uniref:hypothetical protein n=1 Tax=Achromobacter sp. TaxID=134375 RepID=UPI003D046DDB
MQFLFVVVRLCSALFPIYRAHSPSFIKLGDSYSYGWNSHGWLSYSPYRYSYVDNYYDWRRPYHHYPNYRNYYP